MPLSSCHWSILTNICEQGLVPTGGTNVLEVPTLRIGARQRQRKKYWSILTNSKTSWGDAARTKASGLQRRGVCSAEGFAVCSGAAGDGELLFEAGERWVGASAQGAAFAHRAVQQPAHGAERCAG